LQSIISPGLAVVANVALPGFNMRTQGQSKRIGTKPLVPVSRLVQNQRSPSSVVPIRGNPLPYNRVSKLVVRGQHALRQRMLEVVAGGAEVVTLLEQIVAAIAEQLAAPAAFLCTYCEDREMLCLQAFYIQNNAVLKYNVASSQQTAKAGPLWRKLVRTPVPFVVADASQDRRVPFRDFVLATGMKRLLLVPLVSGREVLGLLGIVLHGYSIHEKQKIELATALAEQVSLAMKLARITDTARQSAVLEERSRMARDLHDITAAGFTGILIQLDLAESALFQPHKEARRHIVRARELARESLIEARRAVFALHPQHLSKHCLAAAIKTAAAEITRDTGIHTEFCFPATLPDLHLGTEVQLLRITQEALTNIVKHARSTKVQIELACTSDSVRLSVQDDGHGFSPCTTEATRGFGLAGMEERARQIGGLMKIHCEPGCGTRIQINVPIKPSE
jgi:signal transduction histidine kinase